MKHVSKHDETSCCSVEKYPVTIDNEVSMRYAFFTM